MYSKWQSGDNSRKWGSSHLTVRVFSSSIIFLIPVFPKSISVFCPASHLNRVGILVKKASFFRPTSRPFLLPNLGQRREKVSRVGFCDSNGARGANNFGQHRHQLYFVPLRSGFLFFLPRLWWSTEETRFVAIGIPSCAETAVRLSV